MSIQLPYKENFSPIYAGAVSLFVKDTTNISKYKNHITIYGNTKLKRIFSPNKITSLMAWKRHCLLLSRVLPLNPSPRNQLWCEIEFALPSYMNFYEKGQK